MGYEGWWWCILNLFIILRTYIELMSFWVFSFAVCFFIAFLSPSAFMAKDRALRSRGRWRKIYNLMAPFYCRVSVMGLCLDTLTSFVITEERNIKIKDEIENNWDGKLFFLLLTSWNWCLFSINLAIESSRSKSMAVFLVEWGENWHVRHDVCV